MSQGDVNKAIEYHTQCLAIAKEVSDWAGEGQTYATLGTCHMYLSEYVKAVACLKAQHGVGTELGLAHMQPHAALKMCVALARPVRAGRQGDRRLLGDRRLSDWCATGADQAPASHIHSSASPCLNDRVGEAAKLR